MTSRIRPLWLRGAAVFVFLLLAWVGFYCYRSCSGSYHEISREGGGADAVWFPSDFEPRQIAPPRPAGDLTRHRYEPQTQLPSHYPLDGPLLKLDRWLFHKTIQTVSGQGDMPRLYNLSQNGKSLTPVSEQ